MTIAGTYARVPMGEAFSVAVDELEGFLSRLTRADAVLRLERESDRHWIVVDLANPRVLSGRGSGGSSESSVDPVSPRGTPGSEMSARLVTGGSRLGNPASASSSRYEPTVMIRASRSICERFMVAFVAKHPGSRIVGGEPIGGRVPAATDSAASESPVSQAPARTGELASPLMNVYPIRMLEQIDEEGVPA